MYTELSVNKTLYKWVSMRSLGKTKAEVTDHLLYLFVTFATYLKHKERGKKERRAICSAGMMLGMFLTIIEDFHLQLSVLLPGSTISLGGEEKKAKISVNLADVTLDDATAEYSCQGTEDATKWNEGLAPSAFATMHYYMFDSAVRTSLDIPQPSEMGELFKQLCMLAHYAQAKKAVQIGKCVVIESPTHFTRITWCRENEKYMSDTTSEWFNQIKDKLCYDNKFLRCSPGMLMGMLNAASTTLGLLAANHKMVKFEMKIVTLRSSDDSMSLYLADNILNLWRSIEKNRRNLGLLGINISPEKTQFHSTGFGEFTLWYMDDAQAKKAVQIGKGVVIESPTHFTRITWCRENEKYMSDTTSEWFNQVKDKLCYDNKFLRCSPGMLMGMLNAASTTLGLLAANHKMVKFEMKIVPLRSSDDSMSLSLADNILNLWRSIEKNRRNLGLLGINISPEKTQFHSTGFGEFTSWYMDGDFVSQYGVETYSLRPQGKNPYDDLYSIAKATSTSLSTLSINALGAAARLNLKLKHKH